MRKLIIIIILISNCTKLINNLSIKNKGMNDDLFIASKTNNINKVIELLNKGVDINFKDENSYTALIFGVQNNNIEISKSTIRKWHRC